MVFRYVLLALLLFALLTLIFSMIAPGTSTGSLPVLTAAPVGDRLVVAWSSPGAMRSATSWAVTAINTDKLVEWAQKETDTGASSLFGSSGTGSSAASAKDSGWLRARRGPDGDLLGIGDADDHTLMVVFDGALHLQGISTRDDELTSGQPRVIRTTRSTLGLPESFTGQFSSYRLAGISVLPISGDSGDRGSVNAPSQTQALRTTDIVPILDERHDLLLTVNGLDRFTRLRLSQTTSRAMPIDPPCFLSLDDKQQLVTSETAPPVFTVSDQRKQQEELREAAANGTNGSGTPDTSADLVPRLMGLVQLAMLPGPDDDLTRADVFFSAALDLVEGTDTPKLKHHYNLYWVRLRDGHWGQPVLIGEDVPRFDLEVDPHDAQTVHLLFAYDTPQALPVWKYRRLQLRDDLHKLDTAASDVTFGDARAPYPGLFDAVAVGDWLHLFLVDQTTGRPMHTMARLPVGDRRVESLSFGTLRTVEAFHGASAMAQQVNMFIMITMVVMVVMVGTMWFRSRRHAPGGIPGQPVSPPGTGSGTPSPPDVDRDEPLPPPTPVGDAPDEPVKRRPDSAEDAERKAMDALDPERIIAKFGYHPAGLPVRFFAVALDLMLLLVPLYLLADYLQLNIDDLAAIGSPDFAASYVLAWVLQVFYFSLFEYYLRRTPGKMVFGLHVRSEDRNETHVSFARLVVRNLMRAIDYWIAFVMVYSERMQRPGDRLSHTVVVRDPVPDEPAGADPDDPSDGPRF
ncbi:MAG: RDD family protein [Planctomycetota bacterium]